MIRYGGPFLLLASIPAFFFALGPWGPVATVGLLLTALTGAEFIAPRGAVPNSASTPIRFRILPYFYIPLQLGVVVWAIDAAMRTSPLGVASLIFSVGLTTGVFGMLTAHEMAHSKSRGERMLATWMLSAMIYRHFRISHVHVHHRWAATERDSATARLGEGFYAFLARTVPGQFLEAWRFESKRCQGRPFHTNRIAGDVLAASLIFATLFVLWGMMGAAFFVAQCMVAIVVLELFNYIAHYGLRRHTDVSGRFEALGDRHSWNSSNVVVNLLIFNMGRHSYHHRKPAARYESLEFIGAAPELPAGYAGSILLALVPPLWRRIMDDRVLKMRADDLVDIRLAA